MKNKSFLITMLGSVVVVILIFGFTNRADSNGGILTMRTTEAITGNWDNSITIAYEDGRLERTELGNMKMKDMSPNLDHINENLNILNSKGYKLIATSQSGMEGVIITTYTFKKE